MVSAPQVLARYKGAFVHPSDKAREDYLKEHPKADPKNHSVDPKAEEKAAPKEEPGEDAGKEPEAKPKAKKNFFKGLSEKAQAMVSHSSKAVQKFVADGKHRKRVLQDAGKSILASPKTYAKRLVHTAQHEVHEFKEAGKALAQVARGKELDPQQKKVLKTVAIHMGIAVAAAALSTTGIFAGAAALGKGMAQKVALKAAIKSLEKVHLMHEIQHIGHGLMHLSAKKEKISVEEAFALLVMKSVVRELEELDEKDVTAVLNEASEEQEKVAWKIGMATASDLSPMLGRAVEALTAIERTLSRAQPKIVAARTESVGDRVWQDRFVPLFQKLEASFESLQSIDAALESAYLADEPRAKLADEFRRRLTIPRKATVEYAISDVGFAPHPRLGRDGILYSVPRLQEWSGELQRWATETQAHLGDIEREAVLLDLV